MEKITCTAPDEAMGQRLDLFLAALSGLSRSRVQALIKEGLALVDGVPQKANYTLTPGQIVALTAPPLAPAALEPQPMDLAIVYEDADVAVVNKPRGLVVHPAPGNPDATLVNGLLAQLSDLSGINGAIRPGIVHRIDKDTSGLLLVAKNDLAHQSLGRQLKEHSVTRVYEAIVEGTVAEPGGVVNCPIGRHPVERKKMAVTDKNAKAAITNYRVLERFPGYTHIEARLLTGRTHQIRVHMKYIGHPLLGDPVYGKGEKNPFRLKGQALHARTIGFNQPRTGEYLEFSAPLPPELAAVLAELKRHEKALE